MTRLLLALAGTAALWPMFQFRPDHNAVLPGPARAYSWQRRLGGQINGGLAVAGGVLYLESFDRRVSALDARTGRVLWSTKLPDVAMTTPVVANGVVVVGTGKDAVLEESPQRTVWGRRGGDAVIGLDAGTGRVLWTHHTIGEDMPSPALVRANGVDELVYANGHDRIRALALADGRTLWTIRTHGIATMSSAAAAGRRVYVVVGTSPNSGRHDHIEAIDARSGSIRWRAPYGNADCSPTVADGLVFVEGSSSSNDRPAGRNAFNEVDAVSERTGLLRWRWFSRYGRFTPTGSNEEGVAGLADAATFYQAIPATRDFVAFDARTGRVRWRLRTAARVKMSAVEYRKRLYFGDTAGTFYVVDARSGRVLVRRTFPAYFTVSSPVIVGETLYVADRASVYAIPLASLRA